VDDDLSKWEIVVNEFDKNSTLAKALTTYANKFGQDKYAVVMRFTFPADYPLKAPFVHVVSPKLVGGYVFSGGLCMSTLMQGWSASITPSSLVLQIRQLFMEANLSISNPNKVESWSEEDARNGFKMAASAHANDKSFE